MLARAGIALMAVLGVIGAYACAFLIAVVVGIGLTAEPGERTLPIWFRVAVGAVVVGVPIAAAIVAVRMVRVHERSGR